MTAPSLEELLERIRAEYLEMPGLRLNIEQVHRLFGVEQPLCQQVGRRLAFRLPRHRAVSGPPASALEKLAQLGAPAKFYGDIAVADGTTSDEFFPWKRGVFKFDSNWSGTMAKIDGQWKLVSLHLSTNVFNNPLLDEYKETIWYVGAGAFAAGLVVAFVVMRFVWRPKKAGN